MRDAGRIGRIERVDGGQSRMESLGAGWWRVSRDWERIERREGGEHGLGMTYTARGFAL